MAGKCEACSRSVGGRAHLCQKCQRVKCIYRVEPIDVISLREKQMGVCAICGYDQPDDRDLAIDHDHITGTVRGLLCTRCNMGLGYFSSIELLKAAADYLSKERPPMRYLPKVVSKRQDTENRSLLFKNDAIKFMLGEGRNLSQRAIANELANRHNIGKSAALSRVHRLYIELEKDGRIPTNDLSNLTSL